MPPATEIWLGVFEEQMFNIFKVQLVNEEECLPHSKADQDLNEKYW